ncbi:MAG: hypothetical protein WC071_10550, partial [Victivallaceae bacterium]
MSKSKLWLFFTVVSIWSVSIVNADTLTDANRKLWAGKTAGKNLALGKKVTFSKMPTYKLTAKGETDAADLTDGELSSRK